MTISDRQNSEFGLHLLKAAEVANARVAQVESVRVTLSIALTAVTVITTVTAGHPYPLLAIIGSFWAILATLVLAPWARQLRIESCIIQEQFDTYIFDLPWNQALGSKATTERIYELSYLFKGNLDRIIDWYPSTGAPWPLNVLICQRSTVAYDIRLREPWRRTVATLLSAWIAAGLTLGIVSSMTVWSLLLTWFAPSCAAIIIGCEIVSAQSRAINDRRLILPEIERTIDLIAAHEEPTDIAAYSFTCRNFQDSVFNARKRTNRIPSWFYLMLRLRNERIMQSGTSRGESDE